ncbi:hypothetical protein ADK78_16290 [Kitasatospora aureofaciens]|nr:hypothetical protein ADK78_16290 [Kitasatospora aureofaciens]KOT39907.1 hypothetical protein ADK84_13910 [Streptomyces sp. NRRL WC-3701]KOT56630.1 hypothetical protein ADK44_23005 [Streptomyces rimosus subsp. rimosus]QEV74278.1 hypothetical protein CP984_03825 [Streptomyces rimosus]KOT59272.1 hypothetical protein ADK45_22545 [Streptomyces rimosus subsp. rimosus]
MSKGVRRMNKDTRKGIDTALGTRKKKRKKGAKAQAKQNRRHIGALTEQMEQLTQQVSALTSTVSDHRKDSAASR